MMQIMLSQNAQPFLKYCLQPDEHRFIIYSIWADTLQSSRGQ